MGCVVSIYELLEALCASCEECSVRCRYFTTELLRVDKVRSNIEWVKPIEDDVEMACREGLPVPDGNTCRRHLKANEMCRTN